MILILLKKKEKLQELRSKFEQLPDFDDKETILLFLAEDINEFYQDQHELLKEKQQRAKENYESALLALKNMRLEERGDDTQKMEHKKKAKTKKKKGIKKTAPPKEQKKVSESPREQKEEIAELLAIDQPLLEAHKLTKENKFLESIAHLEQLRKEREKTNNLIQEAILILLISENRVLYLKSVSKAFRDCESNFDTITLYKMALEEWGDDKSENPWFSYSRMMNVDDRWY